VNESRIEGQAPIGPGDVLWLGPPREPDSVCVQCHFGPWVEVLPRVASWRRPSRPLRQLQRREPVLCGRCARWLRFALDAGPGPEEPGRRAAPGDRRGAGWPALGSAHARGPRHGRSPTIGRSRTAPTNRHRPPARRQMERPAPPPADAYTDGRRRPLGVRCPSKWSRFPAPAPGPHELPPLQPLARTPQRGRCPLETAVAPPLPFRPGDSCPKPASRNPAPDRCLRPCRRAASPRPRPRRARPAPGPTGRRDRCPCGPSP
jgi:hypothetical protein